MFLLSKDYWEIRHTEKKGRGVFATKDILPGTVIGDYRGIITPESEINEADDVLYAMHFNDEAVIVGQPEKIGVHLFNHSCAPNCDTYPYKGHMLFFSSRYIFSGEELTINYLLDPPEVGHICNHVCYCDSLLCHGTWHTSFAQAKQWELFVKRKQGNETAVIPVPYGHMLPALAQYPLYIEDDPIYDLFGYGDKEPLLCDEKSLPQQTIIRDRIRKSGKQLLFPKLSIQIAAVMNDLLICSPA